MGEIRNRIKSIVENTQSRAGKAFSVFIQLCIVISIASFSIGTLPELEDKTLRIIKHIEQITVAIFSIEYILRILAADKKLKFATSFFGIIDLLAILPFYLSMGIDLRSIRILRMLRLFRLFKLGRYSKAIQRFHRAFILMREEFILFIATACILIYLSAAGIYYFECQAQPQHFKSIFHSLWWAIVTLTTVGYGDVYPITIGGRIFTFFVLMIGLGIVAVPAGLMSSALTKAREEQEAQP